MTIQTNSPSSQTTRTTVFGVLLLLILGMSGWTQLAAQNKSPYDKTRLIIGLKQSAEDKLLSAQDFVRLIQQRGVDFQMTASDEAELRIAGASNEVIAAIRRNYRRVPKSLPKGTGSLTINSNAPGSKVFVNGKLRGTTNEAGVITLPPMKAGQYMISLKKDNYEDQERSVIVGLGLETSEPFSLSPVKGRLTVIPSISDAQVTLDGVAHPAGITNLSLPAASYEVRVSKAGHRTFTQTIVLAPRGSLTVDAPLQPMPVEELLAQTINYFGSQRYREAVSSGQGILALHPNNPQALLLTGLSYYYLAQYSDSVSYLSKAISVGEQVILPIRHHHRVFLDDALCSGRMTMGQGKLSFTSSDKTGHDFTVPANKIHELTFEPRKSGRVHVQVGIPKGAKEDKKTYNFHVSHAGTRRYDATSSLTVTYCNDCEPETQVIYQLLKQLKDIPYQPSNTLANENGSQSPTLKRRPAELQPINEAEGRPTLTRRPPSSDAEAGPQPGARVAPPSITYRPFVSAGKFRLEFPDNWKEVPSESGNVMIGPDGAVTKVGIQTNLSHGLLVGIYPAQGQPLSQASEQFLNLLLKNAPYLKRLNASQSLNISGRLASKVTLAGISPVSHRSEFVRIYITTTKKGDVFYLITATPHEDETAYALTFSKIVASIEFLD